MRIAIDAALEEKPKDFEELLKKLEAAGLEVNCERKHLRFRVPGQEKYTRCDTLKGDYTEQAIKERIAGTRTVKSRHTFSKKTGFQSWIAGRYRGCNPFRQRSRL